MKRQFSILPFTRGTCCDCLSSKLLTQNFTFCNPPLNTITVFNFVASALDAKQIKARDFLWPLDVIVTFLAVALSCCRHHVILDGSFIHSYNLSRFILLFLLDSSNMNDIRHKFSNELIKIFSSNRYFSPQR